MKISILSDTHSHLDERIMHHLQGSDLVLHAGDFGDVSVSDSISSEFELRGVYGNIDSQLIRKIHPEEQLLEIEGLKVYMRHIMGYPKRYNKIARERLDILRPDIVICGHSHILKVVRDEKLNHIHINPGAAGLYGFHKVRTLIKMEIKQGKIGDMKVVELGKREKANG